MPITSYCKKCGRDVPVAERCPHCGGKLPKSTQRVAWCVEHTPVCDWMCWNAAMRIILPLSAVLLILILLLEGLAGGASAVETLLRRGLLLSLLGLLCLVSALLLLALMLQGDDLLDCAVDGRGVHVTQYLPNPTPLKLLLRLKSPTLMAQLDPDDPAPMVCVRQQELAWKDVARVQLWPDKTLILLYAPTWWMRLALPCTPFTYEDSLSFMRDKLGRKKTVLLPGELVAPPKPKAPKARPVKAEQLAFDLPQASPVSAPSPVPAPSAEPSPFPAEQAEDFMPLADVLAELKAGESSGDEAGNFPGSPGSN